MLPLGMPHTPIDSVSGRIILGSVESTTLTERIASLAAELGFDLFGVAPALPPPPLDAYYEWLARGYHADMAYLARADHLARRADPRLLLPGVQSVICVGVRYGGGDLPESASEDPARGRIARYAWVMDYHPALLSRLERLAGRVESEMGAPAAWRAVVDSGPVLERAYAARAGLGFIGKNTCLIHPKAGSWFFLGELLTTLDLAPTALRVRTDCGTCRRCLDACPTGALVAPYVLDARRCTSYLTIARKGPIPPALRAPLGSRIFGCDICQEVCPFQRSADARPSRILTPINDVDAIAPRLTDLLALNEETFHRRYTGTSIVRAGRRVLARNAAIALGNRGAGDAVEALAAALAGDPAPLVRSHAAWALGRIHTAAALQALTECQARESDAHVLAEIAQALSA